MKNFLSKNKAIKYGLIISITMMIFITPIYAHANYLVDKGILLLNEAFLEISATIAGWGGLIFDLGVDYSISTGNYDDSGISFYRLPLIQHGWTVCRNITNLLLIFVFSRYRLQDYLSNPNSLEPSPHPRPQSQTRSL